jgi:membrane associated rhomboid family serine protease
MVGGTRAFGVGKPTPAVMGLLVLCGAVFILEVISFNFLKQTKLIEYLALTPEMVVTRFRLWQPFTYVFVHDPQNFMHVAFNGLMLWWFGVPIERELGKARFIRLFLIASAVTAGAVMLVGVGLAWLNLDVPGLSRAHWAGPTLGMSGVALAFFTAWALKNRDQVILFMFVVPMKALTMLWVSLGIEVLLILTLQAQAWPAHLSGMAFGAIWATWPRWALRERLQLWRLKRGTAARRHLALVRRPGGAGAADEDDEDEPGARNDRRTLN